MVRGFPAGRIAYAFILSCLLNQDLGFEELVAKLKGQLSRGTVNKYLNELFESNGEFKDFVRRRGRRGPYYIPEEKRGEVELFLTRETTKQVFSTFIDAATKKELAELKRDVERLRKFEDAFADPELQAVLREWLRKH